MQIKGFPAKQVKDNADLLLLQDGADNNFKHITVGNLLDNLTSGSSGGENIATPTAIKSGLVADYQFIVGQNQLIDSSINQLHGSFQSNNPQSLKWLDWANVGLDFSNDSYITLPSNLWFNGDLTIETVVNPKSFAPWSRIIDFGNGGATDNLYLALSYQGSGKPTFGVLNGNGQNATAISSIPLSPFKWISLSVVLKATVATMYLNLIPVATNNLAIPADTIKTQNYIGKSAFNGDAYYDGFMASLRLYNRALSASERLIIFVKLPIGYRLKELFCELLLP